MKLFRLSTEDIPADGLFPQVRAAVVALRDAVLQGALAPQEWLFDWTGGRRVTGVILLPPKDNAVDTALREMGVYPAAVVLGLFDGPKSRLALHPGLVSAPETGRANAVLLGEDGLTLRHDELTTIDMASMQERIREVFALHLQALGLRLRAAGTMELTDLTARGMVAYAMETEAVLPVQAKTALQVFFGTGFTLAQERTMAGLAWAFAAALARMRPGPWAKASMKISRLLPHLPDLKVADTQPSLFPEPTSTEGLAPLED